jgi:hypothetical protein
MSLMKLMYQKIQKRKNQELTKQAWSISPFGKAALGAFFQILCDQPKKYEKPFMTLKFLSTNPPGQSTNLSIFISPSTLCSLHLPWPPWRLESRTTFVTIERIPLAYNVFTQILFQAHHLLKISQRDSAHSCVAGFANILNSQLCL